MWHLLVVTASGARYLFRWSPASGNFYASSVGSSTGIDWQNELISPVLPVLGQRMFLREHGTMTARRITATVVYWEQGRVDTMDPWSTSHDELMGVLMDPIDEPFAEDDPILPSAEPAPSWVVFIDPVHGDPIAFP